ncbi:MAG: Exodeoxyribonuclease 7 large subunit [candidate division BRC1 bacterium ADurb.BinA364]|nr:MAG: Exodeoxyribonuclease 7 large subunit [candidate division BRC1 bacterium ADurb.BinA364]
MPGMPLRSDSPPKPLTVAELTRRVKSLLESQIGFVRVEGELSNWRVSPSGHAYFVLKDSTATVSCVIFRGALSRTPFQPRDGMQLIVEGDLTVYESRGQYQIVASRMSEAGLGLLFQRFNELKEKLAAEGLFDASRKQPIPLLPRRVGLVTSLQGAAIRDMLNVLRRRFAGIHIVIAPTRVQGQEAAAEIAQAIGRLNRHGLVDVIIAGRGGGSIEDLWPFNEEVVARAIAASRIPIVSAVGHETDFTIADFAADLRAPTPSAAAELVAANRAELTSRVQSLSRRLEQGFFSRLESARLRLRRLIESYAMRGPLDRLAQARQRLDELIERLSSEVAARCRDARARFRAANGRLDALDPRAVLARGYSIVKRARDGRIVKSQGQARPGEHLRIELSEGRLRAAVIKDEDDFLDGV